VNPGLDQGYREIGIRSFGRGLFVKEPVLGADLGDKRVFSVREHDLVVSNVFAWEGAVGVAAADHDGLIGSHRFMTWTPVDDVLNVRFAREYFRTPMGMAALSGASPGSAGRSRTLSVKSFKAIEMPVPRRSIQDRVAGIGAQVDRTVLRMRARDELRAALVPAARNQIFSAMS
jgi:type I restriction enzyme S subunit